MATTIVDTYREALEDIAGTEAHLPENFVVDSMRARAQEALDATPRFLMLTLHVPLDLVTVAAVLRAASRYHPDAIVKTVEDAFEVYIVNEETSTTKEGNQDSGSVTEEG